MFILDILRAFFYIDFNKTNIVFILFFKYIIKIYIEKIENYLLQNAVNGDLLITMGAGDVVKVGENLLK